MSIEHPSGRVKEENPYEKEPEFFNDADRRIVSTPIQNSKPEKRKANIFSLFGNKRREQAQPIEDPFLKSQVAYLEELASRTVEQHKNKYPFLSPFGKEDFDKRILEKTVRSLHHRLKKRNGMTGPLTEDQKGSLTRVLQEVYENHVPAYTDMFRELDERKPALEVYLGRDGAFMYYARRAQLWARGESTKGRVVYLNYPRGIQDESFSVEERRKYLKDRGITDVSNAIFIDTGYRGSIPEHILKVVFGIESIDEINKRILLIESTYENKRQVRRSRESGSDVGVIEGSPMLTSTARGLYKHAGNNKLTPYASPHDAVTIFLHEAIKFLCMRHFYLQGKQEAKGKSMHARKAA